MIDYSQQLMNMIRVSEHGSSIKAVKEAIEYFKTQKLVVGSAVDIETKASVVMFRDMSAFYAWSHPEGDARRQLYVEDITGEDARFIIASELRERHVSKGDLDSWQEAGEAADRTAELLLNVLSRI